MMVGLRDIFWVDNSCVESCFIKYWMYIVNIFFFWKYEIKNKCRINKNIGDK